MNEKCVVESPYSGDTERNTEFARNVCRTLTLQGYNPFASHLYYPQFLNEESHAERDLGTGLGYEWAEDAYTVFFCIRPGEDITDSKGMLLAFDRWSQLGKTLIQRVYTQEAALVKESEL